MSSTTKFLFNFIDSVPLRNEVETKSGNIMSFNVHVFWECHRNISGSAWISTVKKKFGWNPKCDCDRMKKRIEKKLKRIEKNWNTVKIDKGNRSTYQ